MKSITDTLVEYENIFQKTLKVDNPALLKTSALGALTNIFANIKYDTAIYYNKLLREMNPATLTDFSSLLFHASILNYNIKFGTPSTMQISFIIPEYQLRSTEILTYNINRSTVFLDGHGLDFTLEKNIEININNSVVSAKQFNDLDISDLNVQRVKNPLNTTQNLYMIEYNGLRQYKRTFQKFNLPDYAIGENYSFSIDISSLNDIYEINAWIRPAANTKPNFVLNDLYLHDTKDLVNITDMQPMFIKYNKFNASQFDNNIYLKILNNQLLFTVGDGINGKKLNAGDQIIIETKLTKGAAGNVASSEMNIENIILTSQDAGGYTVSNKTNIKVLSLTGGENGANIEDIEYLKSEMIRKSNTRNSITSINDFETNFALEKGLPFIDTKFFNSQNHVFVYNIIRDDNNRIIPTTTFNIIESEFRTNLFFPKKTYDNVELVSPFYYKKQYNHYIAYMIQPEIKVQLKTNTSTNKITKLQNPISLYITYDYFEQKTRFEIKNYNLSYTYKIETDKFNLTLDIKNNFKEIINQRFVDEYCLFNEPITINKVIVLQDKNFILDFYGIDSYYQLVKKQENYYYTELDRLDTTKETRHILHIPFLDLNYFKSTAPAKLFTKLDRFFKVESYKNNISFNVGVTQSFYNTIYIEPMYRPYIIDKNSNGELLTTRNIIIIDIIIDKHKYALSNYSTMEELEFDLKDTIYKNLLKSEGFETQFYETQIESNISNDYSMVKNIDVISPKVFTTNTSTNIYNALDNALTNNVISLYNVVDFIPNYFFFDYDTINLNITLG